jgi:tryptophan synthase alpha chain
VSRLAECFAELKAQSKKALIPYVMAGDPSPDITLPLMHAMVDAGASIIELGAPFSDPMADGPVIQAAAERSLRHHTSLHDIFSLVADFRKKDDKTPVVMMGYLNPIEVMGYQSFAEQAATSGIDGVITVDMPPVEASDYIPALKSQGIDPIFLLAPTSTDERIGKISRQASGFVYYVSIKGVTGSAALAVDEVADKLKTIRRQVTLPVGVGFGIKDPASAAQVASIADAVVVGSALVTALESAEADGKTPEAVAEAFVAALRAAMDHSTDNSP